MMPIDGIPAFAFLLLLLVALGAAEPFSFTSAIRDGVTALTAHHPTKVERYQFAPPYGRAHPKVIDEVKLLDIILVASVDGKFHALNRTTGHIIWSMTNTQNMPAGHFGLGSLVRTQHPRSENHEGADGQELYIIEPQSGAIFVLPNNAPRDEPLQRLPFTMSQMSTFSFRDDDRIFVGKQETTMIALELETGRVIRTVSSDRECIWDAFEEHTPPDEENLTVLLDDLEEKPKARSSEIHIARTDYHVTVLTTNGGPTQNLAFSVYGPNNKDRAKQDIWDRTPDNFYTQPLHDGQVYSFMTNQDAFKWQMLLPQPVVAIFDVVTPPGRMEPFVLLQPRPRLVDAFPSRAVEISKADQKTYIGVINGSLFAMSDQGYPLITLASVPERSGTRVAGIAGWQNPLGDSDLPEYERCSTIDCFVGTRLSQELSAQSRHLQGPEHRAVEHPTAKDVPPTLSNPTPTTIVVASQKFLPTPPTESDTTWTILAAFSIGLMFIWMLVRKVMIAGASPTKQPTRHVEETVQDFSSTLTSPQVSSFPSTSSQGVASPTPDPEKSPVQAEHDEEIAAKEEGEGHSDKEGDNVHPGKRRRRRRGKKKHPGFDPEGLLEPTPQLPADLTGGYVKVDLDPESEARIPPPPITPTTPLPQRSLIVSEIVLGYGSHGTVVFKGSLQGRAVAVKRLLQDFVTLASREVDLLQESDDHPNVIRYFYQEQKDNFLYIALELCPASLADIIEQPDQFKEISTAFDPKRALRQITAGLRHLHLLKIVHRDIKPQNILVSRASNNGSHRMLISDFGLCKKLEVDQTSFLPTAHGALAAGTAGWRAPEILRGEVKLDQQSIDFSSGGSRDDSSSGSTNGAGSSSAVGTRLTKSVDVFALGCLFFYTISTGEHPYGDKYEREMNILKNEPCLDGLEKYGEEGVEAVDLISKMLSYDPKARPDTENCLIHPFFWTPARRLAFLQDASDRFEIMERDPREPGLVALETDAAKIVGSDWHRRLDKVFIENLGKYRKYDGASVQDLLRALRNKKNHYQDLPDHVKRHLGPLPDGFLSYFTRRFPQLFLHVHSVISASHLHNESMFRSYYQLSEP